MYTGANKIQICYKHVFGFSQPDRQSRELKARRAPAIGLVSNSALQGLLGDSPC